ncbi:hypothetical protein C8Q77DRAFT_162530 [Trametes polyzona]|nr:hypothetical protein C8Q77DRAFT_162530 [Trametes polyzona]
MESPSATDLLLVPSLDTIFGALLVYRYFRLFRNDMPSIKVFVVCILSLETFHIVICVHTCYYYLVCKFFEPEALLRGVWSIQIQPLICALDVVISQGLFARRAYILRPKYGALVALAVAFSFVELALGAAATGESIRVPTMAGFMEYNYRWDAVAFGAAVASDTLTTGILIMALKSSRTGFKQTDHRLDRLVLYTVNTGLLTSIFNLLAVVFVDFRWDPMLRTLRNSHMSS